MIMALADRDRIFTNLYGYQSVAIDDAIKRGDWDGTRSLLARDPAALIGEVKASGLRGRGGGGSPPGANGN